MDEDIGIPKIPLREDSAKEALNIHDSEELAMVDNGETMTLTKGPDTAEISFVSDDLYPDIKEKLVAHRLTASTIHEMLMTGRIRVSLVNEDPNKPELTIADIGTYLEDQGIRQ